MLEGEAHSRPPEARNSRVWSPFSKCNIFLRDLLRKRRDEPTPPEEQEEHVDVVGNPQKNPANLQRRSKRLLEKAQKSAPARLSPSPPMPSASTSTSPPALPSAPSTSSTAVVIAPTRPQPTTKSIRIVRHPTWGIPEVLPGEFMDKWQSPPPDAESWPESFGEQAAEQSPSLFTPPPSPLFTPAPSPSYTPPPSPHPPAEPAPIPSGLRRVAPFDWEPATLTLPRTKRKLVVAHGSEAGAPYPNKTPRPSKSEPTKKKPREGSSRSSKSAGSSRPEGSKKPRTSGKGDSPEAQEQRDRHNSKRNARERKRTALNGAGPVLNGATRPGIKKSSKRYTEAAGFTRATFDFKMALKPHKWSGPRTKDDARVFTLDDLQDLYEQGFRMLGWQGGRPHLIFDAEGRLIVVLAGHPMGEKWQEMMQGVVETLLELREKMHWGEGDGHHRRGDYNSKPMGNSFGGGRREPGKLVNHPLDEELLRELFASEPFMRMAGFANEQLKKYFPTTWEEYDETLQAVLDDDRTLVPAFPNCAFAACHINFPPNTWTRLHTDHLNLVRGLCAVWGLGNFNPDKGGHLILWDLKLIIRFPPGNLILIPSALITHGNITVEQDGVRCSFVLYSAAGLFRWVHNGFQSDTSFTENATAKDRAAWEEFRQGLHEMNLEAFPKWEL